MIFEALKRFESVWLTPEIRFTPSCTTLNIVGETTWDNVSEPFIGALLACVLSRRVPLGDAMRALSMLYRAEKLVESEKRWSIRISPESSFKLKLPTETNCETFAESVRLPFGKAAIIGAKAGDWASTVLRKASLGTFPMSVVLLHSFSVYSSLQMQ